jgi:UDP-N-acetylmuramoylalanine--D-glutamate ligase
MSLRIGDAAVERLLVVGFGLTGKAVCRYAARHDVRVTISERRALTVDERAWIAAHDAKVEEGGHTTSALNGADAVVLSPSVPMTSSLVDGARRRGIPVFSELDLAALSCEAQPIVGVTGTNGKSSTVALIGELLRRRGWDAPVVGNVGAPFIDVADDAARYDAFVVEASSYQLEQSVVLRPRVGVLLNLEPDHLARHGSMEAYRAAKGRLFRLQEPGDVAVLPRRLRDRFPEGAARRVFFDDPVTLPAGAEQLGPHQRENLRAAICACTALLPSGQEADIPIESIVDTLRLPHRMEPVGAVNGIRVIDDSKATNPASTVAALVATDGPIVLLLGGQAKRAGYEALVDAIDDAAVRRIVLFGDAAERLGELLGRRPVERVADLEDAVRSGLAAACPGDALLFSPACASFDAFESFEERGEAFAAAVRSMPGFSAD